MLNTPNTSPRLDDGKGVLDVGWVVDLA